MGCGECFDGFVLCGDVGRGRGRVLGKARATGLTLFGLEASRRD